MLSGPRLFFVRNDNTSAAALSASPMKEVRPMRLHTSTSPPDRLPLGSAAQCIIRPDGPAAVSWRRQAPPADAALAAAPCAATRARPAFDMGSLLRVGAHTRPGALPRHSIGISLAKVGGWDMEMGRYIVRLARHMAPCLLRR